MANNLYTTKTAALKATKADINKLDAKKILLNGKNIEELLGFNLPKDYPKLVTRYELPEDSIWMLYNDYGDVVYLNFPDDITDASNIFSYSSSIKSFDYDCSNIVDGTRMFYSSSLTSFISDLDSLETGYHMFAFCADLTALEVDNLPVLSNGQGMFEGCRGLTAFNCNDLSSLSNGYSMFYNCTALTTFDSDLSSLTNGYRMFYCCTALNSFNADLSSLTDATDMFGGCSLNYSSLAKIADTINPVTSSYINIGYNTSAAEAQAISDKLRSKGWISIMEYNG